MYLISMISYCLIINIMRAMDIREGICRRLCAILLGLLWILMILILLRLPPMGRRRLRPPSWHSLGRPCSSLRHSTKPNSRYQLWHECSHLLPASISTHHPMMSPMAYPHPICISMCDTSLIRTSGMEPLGSAASGSPPAHSPIALTSRGGLWWAGSYLTPIIWWIGRPVSLIYYLLKQPPLPCMKLCTSWDLILLCMGRTQIQGRLTFTAIVSRSQFYSMVVGLVAITIYSKHLRSLHGHNSSSGALLSLAWHWRTRRQRRAQAHIGSDWQCMINS